MTATLNGRTDVTTSTPTVPTVANPAAGRRNRLVLAAFRVVAGSIFALHGLQGAYGAFGGIDLAGGAVPFGQWPGWYASVIELVCGVLVATGLGTRAAALLCSGAMAYAYFVVHVPMGGIIPLANMGEPAALYSWIFLLIAVQGPGSFALDNVVRRLRRR